MPTLALALTLAPLAYEFRSSTRLNYDVQVEFNGFLPILGGNEGKVLVKMGVDVAGGEPGPDRLKATNQISAFEVVFNGAKLPLTLDNVVEYFPKTQVELSPLGKILSTDAPDKKLPMRLPGLDVKHFPEITYLPIELPAEEVETGTKWEFQRDFGGAPIRYQCEALSNDSGVWKIKVHLDQTITDFENASIEVVKNKDEAVSEVTTTMKGDGTVEFDSTKGCVAGAAITNISNSVVKKLADGSVTHRALTTTATIKLLKGAGTAQKPAAPVTDWWSRTVEFGKNAGSLGRGALVWLKTAAVFGLGALPEGLASWKPYIQRYIPWLRF